MKLETTCDKVRWSMDSEGDWLSLHIPSADRRKAQQLADSVDKAHSVEIKPYRKKRGLSANSYYWALVNRLAEVLGESSPVIHNRMLRAYGQVEVIDGKMVYLVLPDTEEAERKTLEADTYHLRPTSNVRPGNDGQMYRTYVMLRGSSTYDTQEMSRLISGLVGECRNANIETMTPAEIDEMLSRYGGE